MIASQRAGVEQAPAPLGEIDVLVHNAGVAVFAPVDQDTDALFDHQFGDNMKGLHVGTRAALPFLSDGGRIILISSVSGELVFPSTATYSATKAAVADPICPFREFCLVPKFGQSFILAVT